MTRPHTFAALRRFLRPSPFRANRFYTAPPTPEKPTRKLPKSLQKYLHHFKSSPVTHLSTFLVLHELTAIVPLFLLTPFIYSLDLSSKLISILPEAAEEKMRKMEAYVGKVGERRGWNWLDAGWVGSLGVAYAVVKVLMPVRIMGCLWATPWVAGRVVGPVGRVWSRLRGRKP